MKVNRMTRAVLYARVSTAAQAEDDRNSLPVQRSLFEAHCAAKEYESSGIYVDVMSGAKIERPEYQRMLEDARRGRFDVLVVSYLDRLGRDDWEIMAGIGELRRHGITVEPTQEEAARFLDVALSAWKAQGERERISARVSLTMAAAARAGRALGRAPYGFAKRWDISATGRPINHRLEIDESQARWVRWAFNAYAKDNVSLREIARRFSEESAPKANGSRLWFPEEIRKLLQRERYLGHSTWKPKGGERIVVADTHPAIIEPDLFAAVQARLGVKASLPRGRTQSSEYLLSGLLRCAHCGGPMHGTSTRARPEQSRHIRTRLYVCSRHRKQRTCSYANNHESSRVERDVLAALAELAGDLIAIEDAVMTTVDADRARVEEINRALTRLDARLVRNLDLYEQGGIASIEQLGTANAALHAEQQRLSTELASVEARLASIEARGEGARQLPAQLASLTDRLQEMSVPEQKALLQTIIERVELTEGDPTPRLYLRVLMS